MKPPYEVALEEAAKEFDDIPVKSFREFQEQNYQILQRAAEIYAMRFAEWLYETEHVPHPRIIQQLLEQFNQPQP